MKLALIATEAQRALQLDRPPRAILVMRRGARTTTSSPGTSLLEYVELSDDEIGMSASGGLTRAGPMAVCHAEPFEHFRYVPKKARSIVAV
jgi:hypothetical protein